MTTKYGGALVDLGNVIIAYWLSNITPENFHAIDYNSIPEVPDAFDSIKQLNVHYGGNVTIVYKASNVATEKVFGWLEFHQFSERTGIPMSRVYHSRNGRDKTAHIAQASVTYHGTSIVVDDRLEVLNYFVGKVPHLFLFRPQAREIEQFNISEVLSHVYIVHTWQEVLHILKK